MKYIAFVLALGVVFIAENIYADALPQDSICKKLKLQTYGPNTFVVRKDSGNVPYLDFTLSQMIPLWHDGCVGDSSNKASWYVRPYVSFTGEFGFYTLGGRESSPVIGMRYNPKFFLRHWLGNGGAYVDVGYAHESNGQTINTQQQFLQKQAEFIQKGEQASFANDYISKGWDYINVIWKRRNTKASGITDSTYLELKYFLDNGLFQGKPEDFYPWETSEGKKRSEVDGVSLLIKSSIIGSKVPGLKLAVLYTTGYEHIFKYNTVKIEFAYHIDNWPPFLLWASKGYNSTLTTYYRNVTSVGIGFELKSILDEY